MLVLRATSRIHPLRLSTSTSIITPMSRKSSSGPKKPPAVPRPSSSIMLLSPTNQLLLLHRVQTSSSFASAHVFPGGNLSAFHETIPAEDSAERHLDGLAYRIAAIRETFEESGILLSQAEGEGNGLLHLSEDIAEAGRKAIHGDKVRFTDWLEGVGGTPDVDNLIPFTRWVTPTTVPKRFTTQMYVYMLPLSTDVDSELVVHTPTHDGGLEHTAAQFDDVATWLSRADKGEVILYPPQLYLLTLLGQFLTGKGDYAAQRAALSAFLAKVPTGDLPHPTANISWGDKSMSPVPIPIKRADGRTTVGLDTPGPELAGSGRGGDYDRVVVVNFAKIGSSKMEVRSRKEVLAEAEAEKAKQAKL